MLYEGVIAFLMQAKDAIAAGQIEQRYALLSKASEVVLGLQNALDFEQGGKIAPMLYDFYGEQYHSIAHIQSTNDALRCDTVIAAMREMLTSWRGIDKQTEAAVISAPVPMHMPTQAVTFSA